jgi:ketosteroid isomerase-like protein
MRYISLIVMLLIVVAGSGTSVIAQKKKRLQSAAADVESEIRQVDEARRQALRRNDVQALAHLYSDDFMMITSTGEIRTKQDQLRDISAGTIQHQGSPERILKLRSYVNVAVVESESQGGDLIVNGRADSVVRRFTRVYVKTNGRWQLVATHISRVETQR